MIIKKHKNFIKNYSKLDLKIQYKVDKSLEIFLKNHFDKSLNNHTLK
jgi:hypothetical protein